MEYTITMTNRANTIVEITKDMESAITIASAFITDFCESGTANITLNGIRLWDSLTDFRFC